MQQRVTARNVAEAFELEGMGTGSDSPGGIGSIVAGEWQAVIIAAALPNSAQEDCFCYYDLSTGEMLVLRPAAPIDSRFVLIDEKKFYRRRFYSQFGENVLAWLSGGKSDGFYVVVGCHHPFRLSNTAALQSIDFMNIDAEGVDIDVMRSNDWDRFRPDGIAIEIGGPDFTRLVIEPVWRFLTDRDYRLVSHVAITSILRKSS